MPDLDLLRTLAPPVEPADPLTVARARRRALRPRRRRRPVLLAAPVAGIVAFALVVAQLGGERTFAAAAMRMAEASPRLLVDGWTVTRVDEWDATIGEMTFTRDGTRLDLTWSSEDTGSKELERIASVRIAGAPAFAGRYPGTNDYVATWRQGKTWLRARGIFQSRETFIAALADIEHVSAEDWLRALPESAVPPSDQAATVDEMLKGLPLPPGFDREALQSLQTRDRYQLGAGVAGAVACGWIERSLHGDPKAAAALATARDWPVLKQMQAEGQYPQVLWQFADAVADGGGKGKARVTQESADAALGC